MLSTKTKLRLGRLLNQAVGQGRRLAGLGSSARVKRLGIEWQLNLDEGIDFAIYLGVYQRVPARVRERWIKPGALVVDIGANIGAFSLPIAHAVGEAGRVVAVEPTDYAFGRLVANAGLNAALAQRLIPVQAGLTDGSAQQGEPTFFSRWPLDGETAARHPRHGGQAEPASKASLLTLDALLDGLRRSGRIEGPVAFIKLDVDGHELAVLKGGRGVFTGDRPGLLIEIAPYVQDEVPGRFEALLATLSDYGYRLEHSTSGKELPMSADGLRAAIGPGAGIDLLARPL